MNIQFMTAERNGIPTGEVNWKGEPQYRYMPDFDEMIAGASCKEEADAIREVRDMANDPRHIFDGFSFEIVFMVNAPGWDPHKGRTAKKWQMYQHPWYRTYDGIYHTEEQMRDIIETEFKEA